MIINCKLCEKVICNLDDNYTTINTITCYDCHHYYIVINKGKLESETVFVNNFSFSFFIKEGKAILYKKEGYPYLRINEFQLDELNHQLAIKWLNKLKMIELFQ